MNSFRPIFTFAKIDIRRLFRDKLAIFFTIVFPLIFLFVFGGLFSKSNDISFKVGVINQSDSSFSKDFVGKLGENKIFKIDSEVTNLEQAKEKMGRSEIDATIILPTGFGDAGDNQAPAGQAKILYDQNNQSAGQTLGSVLDGVLKEINAGINPAPEPFTVTLESTAKPGLTQFDYTFSGLLGFSILSLGIFGPTNVFPRLKSRGVLRRYRTTPIKVWQYFVANIMSNAVAGMVSVGIMLIVALTVFDLKMRGDYFSLVALIILGATVLFGIGLAVGGWAKNENQAAPLANIITFPMMFLSGAFFPRFLMPEWLQTLSSYLPLTPLIDGARMIITEGKTFFEIMPQVGLLAVWGLVIYLIAFRVFRWE